MPHRMRSPARTSLTCRIRERQYDQGIRRARQAPLPTPEALTYVPGAVQHAMQGEPRKQERQS
ncbi:hypothetical protein BOSEA31B_11977 [Hyphomicrobiales bacterium]|nr:hypothetical protein BOSEA31B_11977 [Hyphomicrobiales bacterium]CAH1697756.1 hypothetical protein BOSEA1005_10801 [Hyphomicrobiales bacterium]CAI0347402.1 hypothetical protein BO1005MUT1_70183 [Hyphomicrobiales bacterium]